MLNQLALKRPGLIGRAIGKRGISIGQLKAITICLVMGCAFYPVIELSRCIIAYNIIGGWPAGWQGAYLHEFYIELAFIWLWYLGIPFIINWVINLAVKISRAER